MFGDILKRSCGKNVRRMRSLKKKKNLKSYNLLEKKGCKRMKKNIFESIQK